MHGGLKKEEEKCIKKMDFFSLISVSLTKHMKICKPESASERQRKTKLFPLLGLAV